MTRFSLLFCDRCLIVEHVELAYFYDPMAKSDLAEPVWVVSGHRPDNQELFVVYLDAVAR